MAAKKHSKDKRQRVVLVSAALAFVVVMIIFGGQLTGYAAFPEFNGTMTITVSSVETCSITVEGSAPGDLNAIALAVTVAPGDTGTDADGSIIITNTGNDPADVNLTTLSTGSFLDSTNTLTFNSQVFDAAEEKQVFNELAPQTASASNDFVAAAAADTNAGVYAPTFRFECDFSPQ